MPTGIQHCTVVDDQTMGNWMGIPVYTIFFIFPYPETDNAHQTDVTVHFTDVNVHLDDVTVHPGNVKMNSRDVKVKTRTVTVQ